MSARHPVASSYDPVFPSLPAVWGALETAGGHTSQPGLVSDPNDYSLQAQCDEDAVLFANNPVDATDTSMTNWEDWARRCSVVVNFSGRHGLTHEQYLFVFKFRPVLDSHWSRPTLQFFLGLDFLDQRQLEAFPDNIGILVDAPPTRGSRRIVVRMASDSGPVTAFVFRGVDIYLF